MIEGNVQPLLLQTRLFTSGGSFQRWVGLFVVANMPYPMMIEQRGLLIQEFVTYQQSRAC